METKQSIDNHAHMSFGHTAEWYGLWPEGRCPTCGLVPQFESRELVNEPGRGLTMIRGKGFGEGLSR